MIMREIVVDVRELPTPEPLERVLGSLPQVAEGVFLKMVHRMEPALLFPILRQNGFEYRLKKGEAGEVLIYIFLKKDDAMREFIKGI